MESLSFSYLKLNFFAFKYNNYKTEYNVSKSIIF